MFAKYMNQKAIRDAKSRNVIESQGAQGLALALKIETARKQLERMKDELKVLRARRSRAEVPFDPPFQLLECAAYLAHCADNNIAPSCKDGVDKLYQVTGAALSYAYNDALYFEWVGKGEAGKLYWRDAGLSDECPLVVIAKSREDQRAARRAKGGAYVPKPAEEESH